MKYSMALLVGLGLSSMVQAQTPHTPPTPAQMAQHEVDRFTTLLSLNSTQQEQATTIFTAAATTSQGLHTSERTTHQALEAAIKANDASAIQQAATQSGQLSGEMTLARATAQAKFMEILTPDQKTKFEALEHGHEYGGDHGGPPPSGH